MTQTAEKHANIPLFIPHMGCPHRCVFCDQAAISGAEIPKEEAVRAAVDAALSTLGGRRAELAFFGGSFTALDRKTMLSLLGAAQPYLKSGRLSGIRLSTRPDAISEEILDFLTDYGVTAIELGVQSMDDEVLTASGRGHTAAQTEEAFSRIAARGRFSLAGQMMLGLPRSDESKELETARKICRMGADSARIYPAAVLAGTRLEKMMRSSAYLPLTLDEGVLRGAKIVKIFEEHNVKILRLGLCAEESCASAVTGGCFHPAYGEMVYSLLTYERILEEFEKNPPAGGKTYTVCTAVGAVSHAAGYRGENRKKLTERFRCGLRFAEREDLHGRQIRIEEG